MERKQDNSTTDEIIVVGETSDKDMLTDDTPQSTSVETSSTESQSTSIETSSTESQSTSVETSSPESQSDENLLDSLPPSTTKDILALWQPSMKNMLIKRGYVNAYNYRKSRSRCVFECLTREQVSKHLLSRRLPFKKDKKRDLSKRAKLADYKKWPKENGEKKYQRGHLAAASNHRYNRRAYKDTFLLSNIVPMCPNVNIAIGVIEGMAQKLAKRHGKVYIATGPYFKRKSERKFVKDDRKVRVPDGIFKVVVHESGNERYDYFVRAYYIENSANNTKKQKIKLADLNRITRLKLLRKKTNLIREEKVNLQEWWEIADIIGVDNVTRNINRSGGR